MGEEQTPFLFFFLSFRSQETKLIDEKEKEALPERKSDSFYIERLFFFFSTLDEAR
jgi:hypothetical protein